MSKSFLWQATALVAAAYLACGSVLLIFGITTRQQVALSSHFETTEAVVASVEEEELSLFGRKLSTTRRLTVEFEFGGVMLAPSISVSEPIIRLPGDQYQFHEGKIVPIKYNKEQPGNPFLADGRDLWVRIGNGFVFFLLGSVILYIVDWRVCLRMVALIGKAFVVADLAWLIVIGVKII